MSDLPVDYPDRLSLAELVSRIERQQAETRKFVAEQSKLSAEAAKFAAEQNKLSAESAKFGRERSLAPWQFAAALMGAGAALFGAGAAFWKVVGG